MITTALPGIRPALRSFVMDEWPQGGAKMRGGRSVRWAQVSAPARASMELVWENITHAQAEQLLAVWDANYGTFGNVTLSASTIAGLDPTLAALIQQPFPNALWRAEGPPVVESVKAWRCTVRLPLRTRLQSDGGGEPLPPEGDLFILESQDGGGIYESEVASNGYFHAGVYPEVAGLTPYWGYNTQAPESAPTSYFRRFIDAGWSQHRDSNNQINSAVKYSSQYGLCHYLLGYNGSNNATATTQRLYRIRIDETTGAVLEARSWDRPKVGNIGSTGIISVLVDSTGRTFVWQDRGSTTPVVGGFDRFISAFDANDSHLWTMNVNQIGYLFDYGNFLLCIGEFSARFFTLDKATGALVYGPFTISGGTGNFATSVAIDDEGSVYISKGTRRILKLNSSLQIVWEKAYNLRGDHGSIYGSSVSMPIIWDPLRQRLVAFSSYIFQEYFNGSAGHVPHLMAISKNGDPIETWSANLGVFNSPVYVVKRASQYGGNILARGGSTGHYCLPIAMDYEGTAINYLFPDGSDPGQSIAQIAPRPTGTVTETVVPTLASFELSFRLEAISEFAISSNAVTSESLAPVDVTRRAFFDIL